MMSHHVGKLPDLGRLEDAGVRALGGISLQQQQQHNTDDLYYHCCDESQFHGMGKIPGSFDID